MKGLYVVRITSVARTSVEMKCRSRTLTIPHQFDWPVKEDILGGIDPASLFVGPIKLKGTSPFIIIGLDSAYQAYKANIA